jgi:phosphoglycerate dehydrogenase-like enzyme
MNPAHPLHITLNVEPYRLDSGQEARLSAECGCGPGGVVLRVLQGQPDLDTADAPETQVLVTEDVPRDLARWPRLRLIQLVSAGINQLEDHPVLTSDIPLATAAGVHAVPIAEHVVCMLLMLTHNVPAAAAFTSDRRWPDRVALASTTVRGKTAGLIGYGGIGRECGRQLQALGMRIICLKHSPDVRRHAGFTAAPGTGDPDGRVPARWFAPGELGQMLPACDVLVVTAPRTRDTTGMIGRNELQLLPRGARVIVVSRGGIVDEAALGEALRSGRLAGAAVDAFVNEPPHPTHPLFAAPNAILTPHVSGVFAEQWAATFELVCQNLRRLVTNQPLLNRVDPRRGY